MVAPNNPWRDTPGTSFEDHLAKTSSADLELLIATIATHEVGITQFTLWLATLLDPWMESTTNLATFDIPELDNIELARAMRLTLILALTQDFPPALRGFVFRLHLAVCTRVVDVLLPEKQS